MIGLVAVAVIGASLQRLVDTPERWGTTWDVAVSAGLFASGDAAPTNEAEAEPDREALLADSDIEAAAVLLYDEQVTVEGVEAIAMTIDSVKGGITPTVIEGREPRADDEIAVARDTLRSVGADLGVDRDRALPEPGRARSTGSSASSPSRPSAIRRRSPGACRSRPAAATDSCSETPLVATTSGRRTWGSVGRRASMVTRRWRGGNAPRPPAGSTWSSPGRRPRPRSAASTTWSSSRSSPAPCCVVLGVLAVGHALIVTVRRRSLELGVLSALGFTPSQRRAVIVAQATTIAAVALVLGVPLGAAVGGVVWSAIASSMGLGTDASSPFALLAAGALGVVAVLNMIATVPARTAGRLRVADALRSE